MFVGAKLDDSFNLNACSVHLFSVYPLFLDLFRSIDSLEKDIFAFF